MEASALHPSARLPALAGKSPLLRLQPDEKLVALTRRGHHGAFEALVQRYESRLLAFCRHMLRSQEDAEDVLQEVFAASFNAMIADDRPLNVRPWLYRIARNRCLNHLRRPVPAGQDSMDIFETESGATTADTVHRREEFRQIVADVQELPETQRTALLLREIDALSYEQIAEAMDTTVPSVKSLLVRARVALAEASEARLLTCAEVRLELGQVAEGIAKTTAPARRHLKGCERCRVFKRELRSANRALAAVYPISGLIIFKKFFIAKLGIGASASSSAAAGGGAAGAAGAGLASGAAVTAGSVTATSAFSAGLGTLASKTAATVAAAAIVTAGAVEVKHVAREPQPVVAQLAPGPSAKPAQAAAAPVAKEAVGPAEEETDPATPEAIAKPEAVAAPVAPVAVPPLPVNPEPAAEPAPAEPAPTGVDEDGSTVALPEDEAPPAEEQPAGEEGTTTAPPGETPTQSEEPAPQDQPSQPTEPAPPAGEPIAEQPAPMVP